MRHMIGWCLAIGLAVSSATVAAAAESKPLGQLPKDVLRWATMWTAIPQEMYAVGQEQGPLAAMTWGPAKGTAVFVDATARELLRTAKSDKRPGHQTPNQRPAGPILRYEF